ncbi:MAG: glycosyltransferase [Paracoccaceae bacterium]
MNPPETAARDVAAIAVPLAGVPILVVTRFSFVGQSGWQGEASRDADLLFQPDRLRRRLALFSSITLPSLALQTSRDFRHVILTSDRLPDRAMQDLQTACIEAYGDGARFDILARPPSLARRPLRNYMETGFPGQTVAQVVLDDDDGLSVDFIGLLRQDLAMLEAERPAMQTELPYFLSYPLGYGLVFAEDGGAEVYSHRYPFINAGLTMIGTPNGKNILGINHLAAPRKFGARLVRRRRMFLRSVHGFNDSRVSPTERWQALPDWRADDDLRTRFPYVLTAAG